jgi:hypothetical protein
MTATRLDTRSQEDWDAELSSAQVSILRTHAARLAEVCADRWADALASGDHFLAAYWSARYARASARCRALGQLLRHSTQPEGSGTARGHVLGNRG